MSTPTSPAAVSASCDAHDDAARVDVVDLAAAARLHRGAGVDRSRALDAGADQRLLGAQARHRLALHVGAHQRAVGVVVLEERDQRRRHRHDLRRRHVHVVDLVGGRQHELVLAAAGHELVLQLAGLVERRVRLRDHVLAFLDRRQVVDAVGDLAVVDLAVRRLEEAVFVGARIERQRIDEADVRAFRRLDRADAAVVRRVHVAHLEARALAREAARPQRRDAPLVRDLRQRVGLVHELRQLRRAEELLDRGRDRLGVDEVVRQQVVAFGLAETLLHRALDAHETRAELVLGELADRAHPAIAEMVDVVDLAAAVAQLDQDADDGEDVVPRQHALALRAHRTDAVVEGRQPLGGLFDALRRVGAPIELHPAHGREVVALLGEEEPVEQRLDRILGRRLARAHHPVDRHARGHLVRRVVGAQRLRDVGALVEVVGVDRLDRRNAGVDQLLQQLVGDLVVGLGEHFTGRRVDDVGGERAADDVIDRHHDRLDPGIGHLADMPRRDPLVARNDDLAVLAEHVEARDVALQPVGHEVHLQRLRGQMERVEDEELAQDFLVGEADRLQQRGHRHLAAAVDAEEQQVLRVELEIEPRAAVGNHAGREQELAGRMRLAAVVLEEHARRPVQLGDDHPLGAVDDERAVVGHERDLAHVDLLLLHLLDRRLGRLLVHDREADLGPQRRAIGEAALLAFGDVERRGEQRVADEIELRVARMAGDREDRRERGLQAFVLAPVAGRVRLQERAIGRELRLEQERHRQHARALGEALADALLLGERINLWTSFR